MRSALVLGCGRSGTSMVSGVLASAGYAMGEAPHRARASNPKGFFETPGVNGLNEELLAPVLEPRPALGPGQRWLGIPRAGATCAATPEIEARMRELLAARPYCHKDPRFAFTLRAWRPHLGDARFVCVFRHPALTATSLLEECREAAYLRGVAIDRAHALRLWTASYRALLEESRTGEWLFLHYDQVLTEEGRAKLARFLEVELDASFPDPKLRRTRADVDAPPEALELYRALCERAAFAERADPAPRAPLVSVIAPVREGEQQHVAELVADARAQRGVETELVLVDCTRAGGLAADGARVVRCASPSRGRAWHEGLAAARSDLVAWMLPGTRALPSRLAHAVEILAFDAAASIVTCDYVLTDEQGQFLGRSSPAAMGEAPGPFWEAGLVGRRATLATLARTAFHPGELELLQRERAANRARHVVEPGFTVRASSHRAAWERSRQDAALLAIAAEPRAGAAPTLPELSVSLCTYDRREVLIECLEAFSRQLLPRGTFELVIVNDGSRDGTRELLDDLELPVPARIVHRENGGLAAARNTGLAVARGRYVLFVNDDTIPFPDCVERHLRRHAAAGHDARIAVLGTFEQPPAELGNALLRHLERSTEIFDYASLRPGELADAFHFYTCNVSVALDAVRRAGAFDPSFRHYGCEDTDLAFRLDALGYRVLYEPGARALHRHRMDFDYLRKRQRTVARAYVRFFRKHPRALAAWGNAELTGQECLRRLREAEAGLAEREACARELASIDVGALEAIGGRYAACAQRVLSTLASLVAELNRAWWLEGYLDGFHEHGLAGFSELLALGDEPHPLATSAERRLLAWPRWGDPASLDRLMELAEPAARGSFAALVLRYAPGEDVERAVAMANLEAAFARRFGASGSLEVLLEEAPLDRAAWLRLGRSVDALLPLGGEPAHFLAWIGAERLATPESVAEWRARHESPERTERAPAPARLARRSAPEISVIVPTHERPRELRALVQALAAQDLEPERYEVLIADDGSTTPAREVLADLETPFALRVLEQAPAGPGAARNLALAHARGDLVVFLNDDAVPARDNLRAHLAAHRGRREPIAALGTFTLLPRHVADSFARYVESSTVLFAQPSLQPGVLYHGLTLCTGNCSLPRLALERVGGFDTSFPYAGGEDSELGLRLEREVGLRVLYDDRIRCGHDHLLEVHGMYERQRVVGWAAHRIQEKHAGVRLVPGWPVADDDWESMRAAIAEEAPEIERVLAALARFAAEERSGQSAPHALAQLRDVFECVRDHGFRRGLLSAHDGELPSALALRPRTGESATALEEPAPDGGGAAPAAETTA